MLGTGNCERGSFAAMKGSRQKKLSEFVSRSYDCINVNAVVATVYIFGDLCLMSKAIEHFNVFDFIVYLLIYADIY